MSDLLMWIGAVLALETLACGLALCLSVWLDWP